MYVKNLFFANDGIATTKPKIAFHMRSLIIGSINGMMAGSKKNKTLNRSVMRPHPKEIRWMVDAKSYYNQKPEYPIDSVKLGFSKISFMVAAKNAKTAPTNKIHKYIIKMYVFISLNHVD